MANITANQLAVGFFNMAAGGYTAEANANIAANEGMAANEYINLAASGLNPRFGGTNLYSDSRFASELVGRLMSDASSALADSLSQLVVKYIIANPTLGRGQVAVEMIKAVMNINPGDVVLSAAAAPFKSKVALADASTSTSKDMNVLAGVTNPGSLLGKTFSFTPTAGETLTGTASDDIFNARILDNANTAQSGDKIVGGAGNDRMNLDIGNSQNFSITLESTGVEQVAIRAQAVAVDSSNNNINNGTNSKAVLASSTSTIDAQRMEGVTQWESNNSRADVVIEDVRIANGAATKTVTIAMVETDPGNVDFAVYFNQLSLRNTSSGTASINIFLMDTAAAAATPATPLLNHNFNTYTFYANNVKVVLGGAGTAAGTAIDNATTYAQLKAAFQLALVTANVDGVVKDLSGEVTVGLSGPVNMTTAAAQATTSATVAANFLNLTGEVLSLTTNNATAISSTSAGKPDGGWTAAGPAPSTGAIVQTFNSGSTTSAELVTSKVILDDVGMGSTGGDLVIGRMSVGETSNSRGVERFEIEVRDNSKLQTINGTNNALREVTIVNGKTSNVNGTATTSTTDSAYRTVTQDAGDLTVNGNVNLTSVGTGTPANTGSDTILKGVNNANAINGYAADHHGAFGFTDVRLIDASAMAGKLAFTAQITSDSIAKYVTAVDTAANPAGDVANAGNANFDVKGANFIYTGGSNNDTMVVAIDGAVAASRSNVVSGLSDFTFNIDGGAGNDTITVSVINGTQAGGAQNWYNNQDLNNNITINGGSGNDTIRKPGAGDVKIDAGSGNDLVYSDNTGAKGQWIYNSADQVTALATARNIADLRSDTNASYNFYNSKLTVTFKDLPSVALNVGGTSYKTSDLELNQAIKNAINTDPTLKALLVATDGPANSLVVTSLIDGVMTTADLVIGLTPLTAVEVAALPASDLAAAGLAYGILAANVNPTTVFAAMTAANTAYLAKGDYVTAMTNNGLANVTGSNSITTSDNLITPGAGNDVIVLGTTVSAVAADFAGSSNETIVFGAGFGNDVIVNFAVAGNGVDHLDFSGIKGTTLVAAGNFTTDKSINIAANTTLATSTTITEKMAIETLFNANNIVAQDHVFVSVNAHNVGNVYSVTDAIGATNAVATLEGSIDLANTAWASLLGTTFVNSAAANFFLNEGPTGAALAPVVPVTPGTVAVAVAAGNVAPGFDANAPVANNAFAIALGTYTYNIANFGAGDSMAFPAGVAASVNNVSFTDGIVDLTYASGGQTVTIHLTGVSAANDGLLNSVADFNTVFGAGTIV